MSLEVADAPMLIDVRFGLMGYFEIPSKSFTGWRKRTEKETITWHDPSADSMLLPTTLRQFRLTEEFHIKKMLLIGEKCQIDSGIPIRGKLISKIPVSLDFSIEGNLNDRIDLTWETSLSYYSEQDALVVFIYTTIPKISLDQLILLQNLKWHQASHTNDWTITQLSSKKRFHSYKSFMLESTILDLGYTGPTEDLARPIPFFSFVDLRRIGPAASVMSHPRFEDENHLTEKQHWGLLSGDEGYRFVPTDKNNYHIHALHDKGMQFCARDYFTYHFSTTNCIGFYSENMALIKEDWARWYRSNVARISQLDEYIRISPDVPCLADGIPVLVELCLLRYVALSKVEDELKRASELPPWSAMLTRLLSGRSKLEDLLNRLELLDRYQDSAVWSIGRNCTANLFGNQQIKERIEWSFKNHQQSESERSRTMLTFLALMIAVISLAFGAIRFYGDQKPNDKLAATPSLLAVSASTRPKNRAHVRYGVIVQPTLATKNSYL